jgi:uroporphyrinogen-III decarboxylase
VLAENDRERIKRDGYGRIVHERKPDGLQRFEGYWLSEDPDLDRLRFDPPDDPRRYQGCIETMDRQRAHCCPFSSSLGLFMYAFYLRGEENFLADLAGDPAYAGELLARCAPMVEATAAQAVRLCRTGETGHWFYDDMAMNNGPMFSPAVFERLLLPLYRRIIAGVKAAGARKIVLHCDGNFAVLLDMLIAAGFDVIQPVEAKAGMDIVALRERYAGRLAFIGGMDNAETLPRGPVERIRREAARIMDAGREGGIVIGTHSIIEDTPPAHYDTYARFVRDYGTRGVHHG